MYPTLQNSCHCLHLAFTSLQALLTAFEVTNCLAKGGGVSNSRSHYDDQLLKQTATRINRGGSEVMAVSLSQPHHDIHSFIHSISIAPLQVHYYSEALPTQHEYCAGISRQS